MPMKPDAILLNDRIVKTKSAPGEYPDRDCPGLRLLIQSSGAKSWLLRYTFGGKYSSMKIANVGEVSLKEARNRATAIRRGISEGVDPKAGRASGNDRDDSVASQARLYSELHLVSKSKSTRTKAERALALLVSTIGGKSYRDLKRPDVQDIVDNAVRRKEGATDHRKALVAFCHWIAKRDPTWTNPCERMPAASEYIPGDRVLSYDEIVKVWNTGDPLCQLLILIGCRRSEIALLQWSEIGPDAITIPIERLQKLKKGKRKSPHVIPITPMIRFLLDRLPRTGKFVINGAGRPPTGHSKRLAKVQKACGFDNWSLHDLRRSFRTHIVEKKFGCDVATAELLLTHKNQGVLAVYDHHNRAEEMAAAWEAWSRHIQSLTRPLKAVA